MSYSSAPNAGNAPSYLGPTPPDRQEMTFGEHLQAALQVFMARPLDPQEMRDMKAFQIGLQAAIREKLQQQSGQPGQPMGPGASPEGQPKQGMGTDEEDYNGGGFGTPVAQGEQQPYGSQ